MFYWFIQWEYYRVFKSGLLIDFYFKRGIFTILYCVFIYFSIYFSEKFFIEEIFLKYNFILKSLNIIFQTLNNTFAINLFFLINLLFIAYIL